MIRDADGNTVPADDCRDRVLAENDRLAGEGLRVLAVASRDIDPAAFDPAGTLLDEVQGLTLLALDRHRRPAAEGGARRDRAAAGRPGSARG